MKRQVIILLPWGIFGLLAFVATLRTASTPLAYVHYIGLAAFLIVVAALLVRYFNHRWLWFVAAPIISATAFAWLYFDYSYSDWSEVDNGTTFRYQDYVWRMYGDAYPYYRRMSWADEMGGDQYLITRFTRYGKKHGLQTHNMKTPKYPAGMASFGFEQDDMGYYRQRWYWYDEEISEGDWVLRNK